MDVLKENLVLHSRRTRSATSKRRQIFASRHRVTLQKTCIFMDTGVRTSFLAQVCTTARKSSSLTFDVEVQWRQIGCLRATKPPS